MTRAAPGRHARNSFTEQTRGCRCQQGVLRALSRGGFLFSVRGESWEATRETGRQRFGKVYAKPGQRVTLQSPRSGKRKAIPSPPGQGAHPRQALHSPGCSTARFPAPDGAARRSAKAALITEHLKKGAKACFNTLSTWS